MHTIKCRLDVERTAFLDELGKAVKGFKLRGHGIQERSSEYVHALDIRERESLSLVLVWRAVRMVDIVLRIDLPWFFQTKASSKRTSMSSRTRSLNPRSVASVLYTHRENGSERACLVPT